MSWADEMGEAFDSLRNMEGTPLGVAKGVAGAWSNAHQAQFSALGWAYGQVADSPVGWALDKSAEGLTGAVEDIGTIIGYPLDKVKRGISTAALLADLDDSATLMDTSTWSQAWDASADNSAGQLYVTHARDFWNLGDDDDFSRGGFLSPTQDPYTGEGLAASQAYYKETWPGRIQSGAVDTFLNFTVDPLALVGKVAQGAKYAAQNITKADDVAKVLGVSTGKVAPLAITDREAKQGKKLADLWERTDGMTAPEIAALPEFRQTSDAGILAHLFSDANARFRVADDTTPEEAKELLEKRHGLKADIFGAALGNVESIRKIASEQADIAHQMKRMGEVPVITEAMARYSHTDFGAKMLEDFNKGDLTFAPELAAEHAKEYLRIERLLGIAGKTTKISSGPLERVGTAARVNKIDGRYTDKLVESYIPNGIGGRVVRVVAGSLTTRIPGAIHLKDATRGYEDLSNVVAKMKNADAASKQLLLSNWIRATTEDDRFKVVKQAEALMFESAADRWGISEDAAAKLLEAANGRRGAYNKALSNRVYSSADTARMVEFVDPEDDLLHVWEKGFIQTHIENTEMISDPDVIDNILRAGTNRRLLERWAQVSRPSAMGAATRASDASDALKVTLEDWGTMVTKVWKDSALMRLAYGVRIQVDTQLRVMAHLGMMKWFMDGKTAMGRYWIEDKDGQYNRKNLIDGTLFKRGSYSSALGPLLKQGDQYKGVDTAPALDDEDVQRIIAALESTGGSSANLSNEVSSAMLRRMYNEGDGWGKIKGEDPAWFDAWKRAADQIRTSPTARKAIEVDDLDALRAWVKESPEAQAESANFVTKGMSQDKWLAMILSHNAHMFPTAAIRKLIATPEKARDLFDQGASKRLAASVPRKKLARQSAETKVKDLTAQIKKAKADHEAASPRSPERKEIKAELARLRAKREAARKDRWEAKAQLADAKKSPTAGLVNKDTGKIEPMDVHGERFSPFAKQTTADWWEGVRESFYHWAADAPETIMGRSPIYIDSFKRNVMEQVDRLGEEGVSLVGADRIRKAADRAARKEVSNVLFDSLDTSNLAHSMRFISPFFSAWEDTMKKWSKLMVNNPQFPIAASKVWYSPDAAGLVVDQDGNALEKGEKGERGEFIVIPQIPGLKHIVPGGGSLKIRKSSANILFQGEPPWLPGNGPLVQIPVNEIARRAFPDAVDNPILKYILPFGVTDDSIGRQLLPSWAKQLRDAFGGTDDFNATYVMLMNQEIGAYRRNERKSEPDHDELVGRTRQWYLLRTAMNFSAPVSIQPTPKDQFYIDEARRYAADPARKGRWLEDFYDKYPDYFEMASKLTVNETGLNITNDAYDAAQKYRADIRENPELGWFFAGADNLTGEFNPNINTWMRSTEAGKGKNFRSAKDPQTALDDIQVEKGWILYGKAATAIDLELEERGLSSTQQAGAEDLADLKREYTEYLKSEIPAWGEAFGPGQAEQRRLTLVNVARNKWEKDKEFAAKPDQVILKNYLDARAQVQEILATRPASTLSAASNQDLADAWTEYSKYLARESPVFEVIYNRVFESDDLGQVF